MRHDAMALVRVSPDLPVRRLGVAALGRRGRAAPSQPPIRVSLLDGFALHVCGREVQLTSCKARALVAYLVLSPSMRDTRERLIGLLWSETEDSKARASLRQLLHCLRETFEKAGVQGVLADKVHVGLDEALFATDLDRLLVEVDRGDPGEHFVAEGAFSESFLRGYDDVDPAFRGWLAIKRESTRLLLIRKLENRLAQVAPVSEDAKRTAAALFGIDPTHETACQALMRACVAAGNVGGALAAYKRLWDRLDQEYEVEPSRATQELVVSIKDGTYQPAGTPPALAATEQAPPAAELSPILLLAVKLAIAWTTAREAAGSTLPMMWPLGGFGLSGDGPDAAESCDRGPLARLQHS